MKTINFFLLIFSVMLSGSAFCQQEFPNTKFATDSSESPAATLQDVEWIAGHWKGEAFGGIIEEVWTPPWEIL